MRLAQLAANSEVRPAALRSSPQQMRGGRGSASISVRRAARSSVGPSGVNRVFRHRKPAAERDAPGATPRCDRAVGDRARWQCTTSPSAARDRRAPRTADDATGAPHRFPPCGRRAGTPVICGGEMAGDAIGLHVVRKDDVEGMLANEPARRWLRAWRRTGWPSECRTASGRLDRSSARSPSRLPYRASQRFQSCGRMCMRNGGLHLLRVGDDMDLVPARRERVRAPVRPHAHAALDRREFADDADSHPRTSSKAVLGELAMSSSAFGRRAECGRSRPNRRARQADRRRQEATRRRADGRRSGGTAIAIGVSRSAGAVFSAASSKIGRIS